MPRKAKKKPQALRNAQARAAGLAATTRGRVRVFEDKRKQEPLARDQIKKELEDSDQN
jgi:hypothetical protein